MERKNQHFTELEYCFGQYFSKYCTPVISKDYRFYNQKQSEEFLKAYNEVPTNVGAGSPLQGMIRIQTANNRASSSGEWSKKNLDNFIDGVVDKIVSNKNFQNDWNNLVDRYRESLIAKLGTKGYIKVAEELGKKAGQKFIDPAVYYGQMRFMELVKEQLAKTNMPKSSLEYIMKEGINSSLMMTLGNRFMRGRDLSPSEEEVHNKGNKLYSPSKTEKGAAFAFGAIMDAPVFEGFGSLAAVPVKAIAQKASEYAVKKGAVNFGSWLGENVAYKTAAKASYVKGLAVSATIDAGVSYWVSSKIDIEQAQKEYSKTVFGNEDTLGKYQKGAGAFKAHGTEYISHVNDSLSKKIKVVPPRPHISNTGIDQDAKQLLTASNGDSNKLLKSMIGTMSKQAIPYHSNSPIPQWMLQKTAKECRTFASSFFSIAKQMSTQGIFVWNISGKNMTLAQVGQRACDYARAAVEIDKLKSERQSTPKEYKDNHAVSKQANVNYTTASHGEEPVHAPGQYPSQSSVQNKVYTAPSPPQSPQNMVTPVPPPPLQAAPMAGWNKYIDNAGLNGFGDVSKNLGYVFAMLPDMLIGMFTGKTSSFTIGNNILPLAAIAVGLFSKNPLLKLMLMGFGGLNLLNNAGKETLGTSVSPKNVSKNYKQYADEPLNPRLSNVYMRGRSLIADIDNRPVVINISDNVVDAYEKKAIPLNTLANAVLRKYDETQAAASTSYDRNLATLEEQDQYQGYGLK